MVNNPSLALGCARAKSFSDNLIEGRGIAVNPGGQRITAEGAKSDHAQFRLFAGFQGQTVIVNHNPLAVTLNHRPFGCEIKRHNRNIFLSDVLPDVAFGPIG